VENLTPRTKEQNEEIRRKRIFQIRKVAAEVYLEKGLHMEIGDIARKAGMGRGTVYHYYNNKFTLLEELLQDAFSEAQRITNETLTQQGCPVTRLEKYAHNQLEKWIEQPFTFVLYKNFIHDAEPIPIRNYPELQESFYTHLYKPVVETIQEGISSEKLISAETETISDLFFGTLIGTTSIQMSKSLALQDFSDRKWVDSVLSILLKGLKV
jgi:AcrR family transcriptional regulator